MTSSETIQTAPIALFVYKRLNHIKRTVQSLQKNTLAQQSELFVFSDAPKTNDELEEVDAVRRYIKTLDGFKNITTIERPAPYGLAKSIITGVGAVLKQYTRVIVLEDDLISAPTFLEFMNKCLDFYQNSPEILSITGVTFPLILPPSYPYDAYFEYRASSWGWGTWKDRFQCVDWNVKDFEEFKKNKKMQKQFNRGGDDLTELLIRWKEGKSDSWAIRWCYHHFKRNGYCIYPTRTKILNIGCDGSGTHCGLHDKFLAPLDNRASLSLRLPKAIAINDTIHKRFHAFYKYHPLKKIALSILKKYNPPLLNRLQKFKYAIQRRVRGAAYEHTMLNLYEKHIQ